MPSALISAGGSEQQQFVRAVATQDHAGRQIPPEELDDRLQCPVAGRVAVRLVEQPEVVDVDERDREGGPLVPSPVHGPGDGIDQGAVVQGAGQRIALGRVHQRLGLAGDPALRGTEDEEQDERGNEGRRQGHDDDVPAHLVELGEDRHGIAPDTHDPDDRPVEAEREVLAHDRRGRERGTAGVARGDIDHVHHGRVAGGRPRERSRHGCDHSPEGRIVGEDDRPVRSPDLDAQDGSRRDQRSELPFDDRLALAGQRAGGEIVGRDEARHEAADERGVGAHDGVQGVGRELRRDHDGLRRGGHPDDHQEDAVDEHQHDRTADMGRPAERARVESLGDR